MKKNFARRTFLGVGLVGTGGALGWLVSKKGNDRPVATPHPDNKKLALAKDFKYDVSEFEKTDPKHLLYEEETNFPVGFTKPRRITTTKDGKIVVAGDRGIKIFDGRTPIAKWDLGRPAHCLLVTPDNQLLVGLRDHFQRYDLTGKLLMTSEKLGGKTYLTSMVLTENGMFMADAGNRQIIKADAQGKVLSRFGQKDETNPGFAIPSPYFDLMLAADGNLRVVNPGRLRVETYTQEGKFVGSWGEPGMRIDRFCGCCNPVYCTLTPDGNFVTSEKGLARINIYDIEGNFKGAVAGPDLLVTDKELAKKACHDCTVGNGFDIAVSSEGKVLTLDPNFKTVRIFNPIA